MHKVRSLEKENVAKTERIQQLQEKNLQAVVQTPGQPANLTETNANRPLTLQHLQAGVKMIYQPQTDDVVIFTPAIQ